jgi:hypothetical protein
MSTLPGRQFPKLDVRGRAHAATHVISLLATLTECPQLSDTSASYWRM